ncbi:MAG: hypothetical protein GY774_36475 [Planctomycetes bacterium]|nr:hypothetical protein [Planctomycetota bacterium]
MKIIRFRGIPIYKILSDDDFVERTQKYLKLSKKFAWIHFVLLLFVCFFLPWLIQILWEMVEMMSEEEKKMVWIGLMLGFTFGAFISHYILIAGQSILAALDLFDFNRGNKLLIKYHDMLKENGLLEVDQEEQDGKMFSEGENDRPPFY